MTAYPRRSLDHDRGRPAARAWWPRFRLIAGATAIAGQSPAPPARTLVDDFRPMPIVGTLKSDVWGAPGVFPRDPRNGLQDETMKQWCYRDGAAAGTPGETR